MNKLYVVPTPIGNLSDFTLRSIEILKSVNYILCEDTKVTGKLKQHLELDAKLISLHKFNEASRVEEVKNLLIDNDVVLVSDAGTPTISDPGQLLIKELKSEGVDIIPLAGANAITTALSGSGLEFSSFTFIGFFDKEKNKIINKIKEHLVTDVIVSYESPNRINKTLNYIYEEFGNINVVVARELTKMYEEIINDEIVNIKDREYKGEIVLLIPTNQIDLTSPLSIAVDKLLELGLTDKTIIEYLTSTTEYKKNDIYEYLKTNKKV